MPDGRGLQESESRIQKTRDYHAAVFGSAARGDLRARSDIDLLVELAPPIGLFRFVGLKLDLEEALGRKVDLVAYDALKPALRARILREQVPIV